MENIHKLIQVLEANLQDVFEKTRPKSRSSVSSNKQISWDIEQDWGSELKRVILYKGTKQKDGEVWKHPKSKMSENEIRRLNGELNKATSLQDAEKVLRSFGFTKK